MSPKPFGKPATKEKFEYSLEEGSGDVIPEAKYTLKCTDVKHDTSEAGNPMWVWDFIVAKGKYAGKDFRIYTALTEAAMWKVAEVLEAMGFDATPGQKNEFTRKEAIGRMVLGDIITDTFTAKKGKNKGKERTRSILDSIEAHPKGAGYKPSGSTGNPLVSDSDEEEEDEQEEQMEGEDEELATDDEEEEGSDEEVEDEEGDSEDTDEEEAGNGEDEVEEEDEEETPPAKKTGSIKRPPAPAPAPAVKTKKSPSKATR